MGPVKSAPPIEKAVQASVMRFYRSLGAVTFSTAQARRSKVALGLPDLFVCWPARGVLWVHEVKRAGGKQSADQAAFQATWEASGGSYVLGGMREAVAHVERIRGVGGRVAA
jgi:hypothetical protein